MGGGDLNTKKSWHPSTLKNQERVWKAEQAVAEEKKRILELQRERDQEHDRSQLNDMAQRNFGTGNAHQAPDNRLHWMYDKPDKQVQNEDYLLGKEIGKNDESEGTQNAISAVSRRVVGSSMTKSMDNTQVDLARKMREDPLLLVKERERAARAALLNNPLQRKRLAELLRKEKEIKESKQRESKTKKKSKKKDKNLDNILAAKLNALGGERGIDLSSLLNSNDSSSESSQSSDEKSKKKKKKEKKDKKKVKKSKKKKKPDSDAESSSNDGEDTKRSQVSTEDRYKSVPNKHSSHRSLEQNNYDDKRPDKYYDKNYKNYKNQDADDNRRKHEKSSDHSKYQTASKSNKDTVQSRKRRSDSYSESEGETKRKINKNNSDRNYSDIRSRDSPDRREGKVTSYSDARRRDSPDRRESKVTSGKKERKQGMSEAERAAKLAEMVAAGKERETERGLRVARQRADDAAAETSRGPRANNEARALPDSLESRIKSNRHYIQRDKMHMDKHFARR